MKKYYLFLLLAAPFFGFSQNNAPVAVNDTFYIDHNDSLNGYQINCVSLGNFAAFGPNFLQNDSDPNVEQFYIDTAFYNGPGFFSINSYQVTTNYYRSELQYIAPINFAGVDSFQYVIKDVGTPTMYDTAWVYLNIKYPEAEYLDINNVRAPIGLHNLFNDFKNSVASFNVPKQKVPGDPYYSTIYAANLWVSGKELDSVYANCETFGSLPAQNNGYDYFISRSGPIMDSIHYKFGEYDYDWDRLWKVNASDIIYHQNNYMNVGYQPIEVIKSWPGNGDVSKGQANQLAPFYDNDNDGYYDPMAGDYPLIKGSQAVYHIYNDERLLPGSGSKMSSEVHLMAYEYNCPDDSALNNTVFVDYTIYNRSIKSYDSTFVGMWTDLDVGGSTDDYVGSDVARSTYYGYNADSIDEGGNGIDGYQNHPPAQGVTFLKGVWQDNDGMDNPYTTNVPLALSQNGIVYPSLGYGFDDGIVDNEQWGMERFLYYGAGGGPNGDPSTAKGHHNYLRGHYLDGSPLVYAATTVQTKYAVPGVSDPLLYGTSGVPVSPTNWAEHTTGFPGGDRRGVGSSGPHTWGPGGIIKMSFAFVFGRDYVNTGNLAGIAVMQERVDSIHSYFRNGFTTTACGQALSVNEKELDENALSIYPNPFNNNLTVAYELESDAAELSVVSMVGQVMMSQVVNGYRTTLDLSDLANGIYFVQVRDGATVMTKKVIKQ